MGEGNDLGEQMLHARVHYIDERLWVQADPEDEDQRDDEGGNLTEVEIRESRMRRIVGTAIGDALELPANR